MRSWSLQQSCSLSSVSTPFSTSTWVQRSTWTWMRISKRTECWKHSCLSTSCLKDKRGRKNECIVPCLVRDCHWTLVKHSVGRKRKKELHSAKQKSPFLYTSLPNQQSRPSSVIIFCESRPAVVSANRKMQISGWTFRHIERQTLASHSSAQTSPPAYLEISQSVRLESTKPSSWLNMCAEYRTTRCTCRSHMQHGDTRPEN